MSNLVWLKKAVTDKSRQIMELSDEYWDIITDSNPTMPKELQADPDSLGKSAVVASLGLMTYLPSRAEDISKAFARAAGVETGTAAHVNGPDGNYVTRVSRGIHVAGQMIRQWEASGKGLPKISEKDSTEELEVFKTLFQGNLKEKLAAMREKKMAEQSSKQMNLLSPEGGMNG